MHIRNFKIDTGKKQDMLYISILFLYSFFLMLFFTNASPFFLFHNWVDSNAFFTMGKGMVHGLVPYRDLFEQKGPLLYAVHAIAYLVSHQTFFGVYIFESIGMGVSMAFLYKTACYYMKPVCALWCSFFLPFFYVALPFFSMGDSAEEFAFPFIMGLIWLIVRLDGEEEKVSHLAYFAQGVSLGCVFWMKYTLIGSWIGFFIIIFFIFLLKKDIKKLLLIIVSSLAGFFCTSLPWLIYFGVNRALGDLFEVYFKINMSAYPSGGGLLRRAAKSIFLTTGAFTKHPVIFIIIFSGMLFAVFSKHFIKDIRYKYLLAGVFLCNGAIAFWGGKDFNYYYLILIPFCSIGLLAAMRLLLKGSEPPAGKHAASLTILAVCLGIFLSFTANDNFNESRFFPENESISIKKEEENTPAQFLFAEIMNKQTNPSLLNYGSLDGGFYTAADILPSNRCFERQNISYHAYPDIMDEQNEVIAKKQVDFVVFRGSSKKDLKYYLKKYKDSKEYRIDTLLENYSVIANHSQKSGKRYFTYWLLQKK